MMSRLILLSLMLAVVSFCYSQGKHIIGVETGFLQSNIVTDAPIDYQLAHNGKLGAFYMTRLGSNNDKISIRTGLLFESKGGKVTSEYIDVNSGYPVQSGEVYNILNYWTIPLNVMIFPLKKPVFFVEAGIYGSYLGDQTFSGKPIVYSIDGPYQEDPFSSIRPDQPRSYANTDFGINLGVGFSTIQKGDERLLLILQITRGLTNISNDAQYDQYQFYNQTFQLTISYGHSFEKKERND